MSPEIRFAELTSYAIGGGWGGDEPQDGTTEVAVIRGTDIPNAKYGEIDSLPVRHEKTSKANKRILIPGDIVIEISGGSAAKEQATGRSVLVTEQMIAKSRLPLIPASFCRLLRLDANLIDPRFAYYALLDMYNSGRAGEYENQSTGISNFQFADFLEREVVRVCDRHEQEVIAHILGTLDDKIKLNRKTSKTLEEIAKALFKSWFVDFDPVRAKAEGRPTGLPAEISDLFPDSLEDSELGEIPSGWKVAELGDCSLDIESGRRPKGGIDKNLAFGIPSIGAESISPIGKFDFSKTKWVDAAFAQSAGRGWIQNYDVALYKDGGKPGEFRPRTALYGDGFPFEKAMVNEHVFLLRCSQLGQPYLYYLFNFDLVLAQIIHKGSSKGAQPGLNQDEVRTSSFVKPDKRLLDVFNLTIESSIRKQLLLGKESQVLTQLRNALLPKLISGEIRIPDAEKMLEEVGI